MVSFHLLMFSLSCIQTCNQLPLYTVNTLCVEGDDGQCTNVYPCIMYVSVWENKPITVSTCCMKVNRTGGPQRAQWLLFDFVKPRMNQSEQTHGRRRRQPTWIITLQPASLVRTTESINGVRSPPAYIYHHSFRSHLSSENPRVTFQTKWCQTTPTV